MIEKCDSKQDPKKIITDLVEAFKLESLKTDVPAVRTEKKNRELALHSTINTKAQDLIPEHLAAAGHKWNEADCPHDFALLPKAHASEQDNDSPFKKFQELAICQTPEHKAAAKAAEEKVVNDAKKKVAKVERDNLKQKREETKLAERMALQKQAIENSKTLSVTTGGSSTATPAATDPVTRSERTSKKKTVETMADIKAWVDTHTHTKAHL